MHHQLVRTAALATVSSLGIDKATGITKPVSEKNHAVGGAELDLDAEHSCAERDFDFFVLRVANNRIYTARQVEDLTNSTGSRSTR